jgi:hypothetical protein
MISNYFFRSCHILVFHSSDSSRQGKALRQLWDKIKVFENSISNRLTWANLHTQPRPHTCSSVTVTIFDSLADDTMRAVSTVSSSVNHNTILWGTEGVIPRYNKGILVIKLHGLSPRANYTDRATAACRRSDCQPLRIEGAKWSAWLIPTAVFSVF